MEQSRDRIKVALSHQNSDRIPIDFGSTAVTGIHCRVVEKLREYYKLPFRPVKIVDSFQMLGEVDAELADAMGIDCIGVGGIKIYSTMIRLVYMNRLLRGGNWFWYQNS